MVHQANKNTYTSAHQSRLQLRVPHFKLAQEVGGHHVVLTQLEKDNQFDCGPIKTYRLNTFCSISIFV